MPTIVVNGLAKSYGGGVEALAGIDLRAHAGELIGLVGANGAGKTTVLRILGGLLRPSAGTALILGVDVERDAVGVRRLVGTLPADDDAPPHLTGRECVELVARLHGLPGDAARQRADDLLGLLDVAPAERDRAVSTYSTGTRRKASLACALVHAPRVLLLDEPLAALDPVATATVRRTLRALADGGCTVLCSSHALDAVDTDCDRVAVLHAGRLSAYGTPGDVRASAGVAPDASLLDAYLALLGEQPGRGLPEWLV